MEKKLLTGAIASAVAIAYSLPAEAKPPNAREGLDNPLDEVSCWGDSVDGFTTSWYDPNEDNTEDTKYGGDLEVDAVLFWSCDFYETAAEETGEPGFGSEDAIVDIDLSRDAEDPFFYDCEAPDEGGGVWCMATVAWEDVQQAAADAAEDRFGDLAEECSATIEQCETVYHCNDGDTLVPEEGGWVCESLEGSYEPEAIEQCEEVVIEGNFETWAEVYPTDGGSYFGVKEMNPGKNRGRQNWEKAGAFCEFNYGE